MLSFDAYEQNLAQRLQELRDGDAAYEGHCNAVLETLPYSAAGASESDRRRILDVGCGLGFMAVHLAQWQGAEVVGIDPSEKAIELARAEHASVPNVEFHAITASNLELGLFDRAIINMVLHSVDNATCLDILSDTKKRLKIPGILTVIVPGQIWLLKKLLASADSQKMETTKGTAWVAEEMRKREVELQFGINGQPTYQEPITVYNRSLSDYARLLLQSGFEIDMNVLDPKTMTPTSTIKTAYWEWSDHTTGHDLSTHDRHILMTQTK